MRMFTYGILEIRVGVSTSKHFIQKLSICLILSLQILILFRYIRGCRQRIEWLPYFDKKCIFCPNDECITCFAAWPHTYIITSILIRLTNSVPRIVHDDGTSTTTLGTLSLDPGSGSGMGYMAVGAASGSNNNLLLKVHDWHWALLM